VAQRERVDGNRGGSVVIDNLTLVARAVWHAVALVVAAGWWAFAAIAVVAVVRAVTR